MEGLKHVPNHQPVSIAVALSPKVTDLILTNGIQPRAEAPKDYKGMPAWTCCPWPRRGTAKRLFLGCFRTFLHLIGAWPGASFPVLSV